MSTYFSQSFVCVCCSVVVCRHSGICQSRVLCPHCRIFQSRACVIFFSILRSQNCGNICVKNWEKYFTEYAHEYIYIIKHMYVVGR